ncbi:MAG: TfoX/Sxy family DNA transformation protein [Planctomycetia bacterium]
MGGWSVLLVHWEAEAFRMNNKRSDLVGLRNLGPTIIRRLASVGVHSKQDLQRLGAVEIYRRLRAASGGRTVPVCYYLYSLQGALMDLHWDDLPSDMKARLRVEAVAAEPHLNT